MAFCADWNKTSIIAWRVLVLGFDCYRAIEICIVLWRLQGEILISHLPCFIYRGIGAFGTLFT